MTEDRLKDKIDAAQEAEADPDRHYMELAILATTAIAPHHLHGAYQMAGLLFPVVLGNLVGPAKDDHCRRGG